jgi:hypothetical protein
MLEAGPVNKKILLPHEIWHYAEKYPNRVTAGPPRQEN